MTRFIVEIGVTGFGKKRISMLDDVHSIEDLYSLSRADLGNFKGFGPTTAESFYAQIRERIDGVRPGVLLSAIGPPGIRAKLAASVVARVPIETIFGNAPLSPLVFKDIPNIGVERAQSLVDFHAEGRAIITTLKSYGLRLLAAVEEATSTTPAKGKAEVVCMTGKGRLTRTEYEQKIASRGWRVVNSVSGKSTLVVTDDPNGGTKKILDARRLAVPIISYEELEKRLG